MPDIRGWFPSFGTKGEAIWYRLPAAGPLAGSYEVAGANGSPGHNGSDAAAVHRRIAECWRFRRTLGIFGMAPAMPADMLASTCQSHSRYALITRTTRDRSASAPAP